MLLSRTWIMKFLKSTSSECRPLSVCSPVSFVMLQLIDCAIDTKAPPVCDRCHNLLHHQVGASIQHPSIHSIQDTIFESPHKYNHIYHVLDAADFPMSLVPHLHKTLHLTPQRSLNRRSKTGRFYHGKKTEVSFIITRSDLLAPLKSQVDSLMPYLVEVLRDALGSMGKDIRLGNVKCVSAKRGWWTKELKEDIWNRGGGGWMVGKVNVGKSQLFESIFPKGRRGIIASVNHLSTSRINTPSTGIQIDATVQSHLEKHVAAAVELREDGANEDTNSLSASSLLPPSQPELDYPAMPLVSPLPGTTASPIRLSFGNGRGELVDLPGLARGDLELQVQEAHRSSLVMKTRILPEQQVIKPGQSLLIGGFIRITPTTPDTIVLAYAFTPIESHLTSTEKAIGIQAQERDSGVSNIAIAGSGQRIRSAGKFSLKWDVTKQRTGPVTERSAAGIKVDRLPYRVLSTDILIEGCGWVELVVQVRTKTFVPVPGSASYKSFSDCQESENDPAEPEWPEVEIFSPEGRFIAARKPMGAWLLGIEKRPTAGTRGRPRQSMKGAKKEVKRAKNNKETI
jgi:hypothetical protein